MVHISSKGGSYFRGKIRRKEERKKKKGKGKGNVRKALCSPVTNGLETVMGKMSWGKKRIGRGRQGVGKCKVGKGRAAGEKESEQI